jgi:hypothetical protein
MSRNDLSGCQPFSLGGKKSLCDEWFLRWSILEI